MKKGFYTKNYHNATYTLPPEGDNSWTSLVFMGSSEQEVINVLFGEDRLLEGRKPTFRDVERALYEQARALLYVP